MNHMGDLNRESVWEGALSYHALPRHTILPMSRKLCELGLLGFYGGFITYQHD